MSVRNTVQWDIMFYIMYIIIYNNSNEKDKTHEYLENV